MAESFELTDEMRALVGQESPPWPYEVTSTSVRAFARGVGFSDPVYYEVEAAKAAGYRDLPAPPTYLGTPQFIPGRSHDVFSGPVHAGPKLEHGLPNILDGGTETEYFEDICAGDVLMAVLRVAALESREMRQLGKALFLKTETTYTNQLGRVAAIQRSQIVYY